MSRSAVDPVTGRWVGALWNLANGQGAADAVMADLERLAVEFQSPAVRAFFLGGVASMRDRRGKLQPLLDTFQALTQRFVSLCLDRGRLDILPAAYGAFRALRLEQDGIVEGKVESPRPLSDQDVAALEKTLGGRLGKQVRLTQTITPDLMGGVRVTVGDKMIDASIAGRFDELRRRMLDVRLPPVVVQD